VRDGNPRAACVQIWATMNNCAGVSRDVMLSQDALEAIVHKTLEQLRNPGLQCLNMVTTELLRIADECTPAEICRWRPLCVRRLQCCALEGRMRVPASMPMQPTHTCTHTQSSVLCRFPALQDGISAVVRGFIAAAEEKAKAMLLSLFECEMTYINTDHPDYIGMQRAWKEHMASKDGEDGAGSDDVDRMDALSRPHSPPRRGTHPQQPHARHHVRPLHCACARVCAARARQKCMGAEVHGGINGVRARG
jgi:hypothetical protein